MPLLVPTLDNRRYQDLVDEALARIPVHTPEWTNFNDADPGVTLIQLFAFLTENLLYRSNQIPERNRRKFLTLLGLPLYGATGAHGLVSFSNERGPLETITLNGNMELSAGQVPFRTTMGLDVLPVEWRVMYKQPLPNPSAQVLEYYRQLYASFGSDGSLTQVSLYQTQTLTAPGPGTPPAAINLMRDTIDRSLWIALLARSSDRGRPLEEIRTTLRGKTVSLGIVPALTAATRRLAPGGATDSVGDVPLIYEIPNGERLTADRQPVYKTLDVRTSGNVLTEPSVVQITLPAGDPLALWSDLDPLEMGTGDFPPTLEDTSLSDRLITWIRLRLPTDGLNAALASVEVLWSGINSTTVSQRTHIADELLPSGTGEPDQAVFLARVPVIPESVQLTVTTNRAEPWTRIDDLLSAGPEIPVRDPRLPPSAPPPKPAPANVFTVDAESGKIQFGDGLRGRRPPFGAALRAAYDYSVGRAGNVGVGAIASGPTLPPGFKVGNPVPTWGGADAESVADGEKQITGYLRNRDRLVTADDFQTITARTPGVDIGRVDVLPVFNPELVTNAPGDAPGSVTVMVIPKYDPVQPDAPLPDRLFLNTICAYLEPRRLVTTEVFLRGPVYQPIWISVGIDADAGTSQAQVREAVKQALQDFLSPLPLLDQIDTADASAAQTLARNPHALTGWPLLTPIIRMQLLAVASRVDGVSLVNDVLLAAGDAGSSDRVDLAGLQLPRVLGIEVTAGAPLNLDELRRRTLGVPGPVQPGLPRPIPVPFIPEECR